MDDGGGIGQVAGALELPMLRWTPLSLALLLACADTKPGSEAGAVTDADGDGYGAAVDCDDGSAGARAARSTTRIFSSVASGSPGIGEASIFTSPPTA